MVDAETVVFLPCAGAIVPPGKLFDVAIHFSKEIDQSPLFDVMDRRAFGLCKMPMAFPDIDVPHVRRVGCDIELATEQNVAVLVACHVKVSAQSLYPVELEGEFVCSDLGAVRNVCIDDADAF